MVRETEEFASEDEAQRKKIEADNQLQNHIRSLKNGPADSEGLGSKISDSANPPSRSPTWKPPTGLTRTVLSPPPRDLRKRWLSPLDPSFSSSASHGGSSGEKHLLHSQNEL